MSKTIINLSIILGLATVAFAGFYLYTQRDASTLNIMHDDAVMKTMLDNSKVFVEHQKVLKELKMDLGIFDDERFLSLNNNYYIDLEKSPVGRENPFSKVEPIPEDSNDQN